MVLVKVIRNGQITLPAEARKKLRIGEGDYLEAEVAEGALTLRPVTVTDRAAADRRLEEILDRVRYVGPEPAPTEDEVMEMVVEEIHALRRGNDKSGS
ncbi:MAG TPA: AbrB/MazE/SpoVT family DNA-binding domain-containing protein [Geminicoccaceae bacterium]|nr:AbrB/MazE/SpoVT family DNA-binding domain-containing protein [Geminicoccaceae bacterium]